MFVSLFSAITVGIWGGGGGGEGGRAKIPKKAQGGEQNFRWNPGDVSGEMLNRKIEGHKGKPV